MEQLKVLIREKIRIKFIKKFTRPKINPFARSKEAVNHMSREIGENLPLIKHLSVIFQTVREELEGEFRKTNAWRDNFSTVMWEIRVL